jgi:galactose mutarotase-like enzyme
MGYQTYDHNRNYGCRLMEFVYRGYRCLTLENELLRVMVVADKGTDIYEFLYKPRDVEFLWRSPLGLRSPPLYPPSTPRPAGPHLDYYEGGWQEMFPNCGTASSHQGAEVGQHGEVLLLPWTYSVTKDSPQEIEVKFEVRTVRTPFHLVKHLSLTSGNPALTIRESVTNVGGQEVDFTWGHHPALGTPFLEEGCTVSVPACSIRTMPSFTAPTSRLKPEQLSSWPNAIGCDGSEVDLSVTGATGLASNDMVFLEGITDGQFAVTNPRMNLGFAMRYPANIFKYLWYWQVFRGAMDYPFWGATYNIALEPCATLPSLSEAAKKAESLKLSPGQTLTAELSASVFEGRHTNVITK